MKVTKDQVEKALASLEAQLAGDGETVSKASSDDLDQPEGADMGAPGNKMSDAAKSKKKAMKGDLKIVHEDEDEDEGDDEDEGEDMKMAKKSFSNLPEEIETKIDVSDFLKSLVDHTGDCINSLTQYVAKSEKSNSQRYDDLTEAVEDLQKSQAKIGVVLKAICQRIGVIESAPASAPKSTSVAKSEGTSIDRKFNNALEGEGEEKMFKSLSNDPIIAKSQIANAMCDLVKKGEAEDMDVIGFESGGYIRPELVSKLKTLI